MSVFAMEPANINSPLSEMGGLPRFLEEIGNDKGSRSRQRLWAGRHGKGSRSRQGLWAGRHGKGSRSRQGLWAGRHGKGSRSRQGLWAGRHGKGSRTPWRIDTKKKDAIKYHVLLFNLTLEYHLTVLIPSHIKDILRDDDRHNLELLPVVDFQVIHTILYQIW